MANTWQIHGHTWHMGSYGIIDSIKSLNHPQIIAKGRLAQAQGGTSTLEKGRGAERSSGGGKCGQALPR